MNKVKKERDNIKHKIQMLEEKMKVKSGLVDQKIAGDLSQLYQKLAEIDKRLANDNHR